MYTGAVQDALITTATQMGTRVKSIVVVGCLLLGLGSALAAATARDKWSNLKLIRHDNTYTFAMRGGACVSGQIAAVTGDTVDVEVLNVSTLGAKGARSSMVRIKRQDLICVKDGTSPNDIVYSGRSSWSDVLGIRGIFAGEYLLLVTKTGKEKKGKLLAGSLRELRLKRWGKSTEIAKSDVSMVYYVRTRPPSESVVWSEQEMFLFDPRLWPYMLGVAPKMKVLLYDASQPEDDRPILCSKRPAASP